MEILAECESLRRKGDLDYAEVLAGHNAFELETHIRIVGEFGGLVGCGECCYGACERASPSKSHHLRGKLKLSFPLFDQELKKLARSLGVSSSDLD